ncbi:MAG: DUF501 domain-containing protein [Mycobacteriales bacterium]
MTSPTRPVTRADADVVTAQLGRPPRGLRGVAHHCACGLPDVVETAPRLSDGTPFPTLYWLTCPRARSAIGRLEAGGVMAEMSERLRAEPALATQYAQAHTDYVARRDEIEALPGAPGAGGMPNRVKCLHVLVAHELAVPGANPLGRATLDLLDDWGVAGTCVPPEAVHSLRVAAEDVPDAR